MKKKVNDAEEHTMQSTTVPTMTVKELRAHYLEADPQTKLMLKAAANDALGAVLPLHPSLERRVSSIVAPEVRRRMTAVLMAARNIADATTVKAPQVEDVMEAMSTEEGTPVSARPGVEEREEAVKIYDCGLCNSPIDRAAELAAWANGHPSNLPPLPSRSRWVISYMDAYEAARTHIDDEIHWHPCDQCFSRLTSLVLLRGPSGLKGVTSRVDIEGRIEEYAMQQNAEMMAYQENEQARDGPSLGTVFTDPAT